MDLAEEFEQSGGRVAGAVIQHSLCTWEDYWLRSHRAGDDAAQAQALPVLRERVDQTATTIVNKDNFRGYGRELVQGAASGDPEPVRYDLAVNCGRLR